MQSGGTIIRAITVSQQIICFTISHILSPAIRRIKEIISLSPHKGERAKKEERKKMKMEIQTKIRYRGGECSNKIGRIRHAVVKFLSRFRRNVAKPEISFEIFATARAFRIDHRPIVFGPNMYTMSGQDYRIKHTCDDGVGDRSEESCAGREVTSRFVQKPPSAKRTKRGRR